MKCGEVAAVEEVEDINYSLYSYYENVTNDAIALLGRYYINNPNGYLVTTFLKSTSINYVPYFYYGNYDTTDYLGGKPLNKSKLNVMFYASNHNFTRTATTYDYLGLTGKTMYNFTGLTVTVRTFTKVNEFETHNITSFYIPLELYNYQTTNWIDFINAVQNDNTQEIINLLEDIKTEQQEINDYLQSDDTSEVDTTLPTESAVDPTDSLWNDMFTNIRAAATSNTPQYISITIPFINKSFTFSPIEQSPMAQIRGKMKPLYDLIIASWWFGASMWIIRDIHKYIEDIKNGNINTKDNNIKTEVL